jgi:LuxR family transcriptional regulator, regulator of acetate metabolism
MQPTILGDLANEQFTFATVLTRDMWLRQLARDARGVTGAELAFVAERDEESVHIRHLSGHVTDSLVDLVVPIGRGIGGLAARERRTVFVDDYYEAAEITHDFDAAGRAEGVKSAAAAPLVVDDEVKAVLYVATRTGYSVGDRMKRDVSLLSQDAAKGLVSCERVNAMIAAAVYEDRRRLAVRLHDSVGQMLFGVGVTARELREDWQHTRLPYERLENFEQRVRDATAALREAISALTFAPDERELALGLGEDVNAFAERTGVTANFVALSATPPLGDSRTRVLHRVCREALLNVEKHAHATTVVVVLHSTAEGVGLTVIDDGQGYRDINAPGMGLRSCRSELERVGGHLGVSANEDGAGTTLRAWMPL